VHAEPVKGLSAAIMAKSKLRVIVGNRCAISSTMCGEGCSEGLA
jgi:hypothetical protein